ncbi:MAG: hypothetical protein ACI4UN_08875 [Muribaculaceae bacterium]
MKLWEMSRSHRMALLAVVVLLAAAVAAVVLVGGRSEDAAAEACDSVEMARFGAEIDSAHIDTVKPQRKRKVAENPAKTKRKDNDREIPRF